MKILVIDGERALQAKTLSKLLGISQSILSQACYPRIIETNQSWVAIKLVLHRAWIVKVAKHLFSGKRPSAPVERRGLAYERATVLGGKGQ